MKSFIVTKFVDEVLLGYSIHSILWAPRLLSTITFKIEYKHMHYRLKSWKIVPPFIYESHINEGFPVPKSLFRQSIPHGWDVGLELYLDLQLHYRNYKKTIVTTTTIKRPLSCFPIKFLVNSEICERRWYLN